MGIGFVTEEKVELKEFSSQTCRDLQCKAAGNVFACGKIRGCPYYEDYQKGVIK